MATVTGVEMNPKKILEGPYHRVVVPDGDGFFSAEISEFPGCVAVGASAVEALTNLEEVAESWLASVIANGQEIPDPEQESDYSGKLVLRLPKSLHGHVAHAASRDGVSINAYLCAAVAHYTGLSEGARSPANVVNFITGPNYVNATNVQQNLFVGVAGNAPAPNYTPLSLAASGTAIGAMAGGVTWGGRRLNG